MHIHVITLFPEFVENVVKYGVTGRAFRSGLLTLQCWNPRDYSNDRHRTVDDRPYGGGPGMVMKADVLLRTIQHVRKSADSAKLIYLSPQGKPLQQAHLQQFSENQQPLILLAGRYEGVDERVIHLEVDEECSIGDYVLSGGELAAMVLIDGITRLLPGALGHKDSAIEESFVSGLLDYPHYTRPEVIENFAVPSVLKSGNHVDIARWRQKQALGRTASRRLDLLNQLNLSPEQQALLDEYQQHKK